MSNAFSGVDAEKLSMRPNFRTADATLVACEQVNVLNNASHAAAAWTLTLPNLSEAAGRIYSFYVDAFGSATSLVVQDQDDSRGAFKTWTAATPAAGQYLIVYCDGQAWHEIAKTWA